MKKFIFPVLFLLSSCDTALATYTPQTILTDATSGDTAGVNGSHELAAILSSDSNVCKETGGNLAAILSALGSPFQAGGSIANTSFAATQATAANLNATVVGPSGVSLAEDSSLATINSTLGSPMQNSGGSVGISGTLPAFSSTPTVNLGTISTAATASNQATAIANQTNGTQITQVSSLPSLAAGSNAIGYDAGRGVVATFTQSYSSSNLTTSAFTNIITSTSSTINEEDIFDNSGGVWYLAYAATCDALSNSSNAVIIGPGGGGKDFQIPSGNCVGFQAIGTSITTGNVYMTFYK